MADRFHMLPSEIVKRATTYDYMIMDILGVYNEYESAQHEGRLADTKIYGDNTDQLAEMLAKSRELVRMSDEQHKQTN